MLLYGEARQTLLIELQIACISIECTGKKVFQPIIISWKDAARHLESAQGSLGQNMVPEYVCQSMCGHPV